MKVRCWGYRGYVQIPGGPMVLAEPYEFGQIIEVTGDRPAKLKPVKASHVTVLVVEVEFGKTIRYEITHPGSPRTPGDGSPRLTGIGTFQFGDGWGFSVIAARL